MSQWNRFLELNVYAMACVGHWAVWGWAAEYPLAYWVMAAVFWVVSLSTAMLYGIWLAEFFKKPGTAL